MSGSGTRRRALAEGAAAVGVIVSLVFVGFEVRQNTVAARAQAYQEIGLTVAQFWHDDASNPQLLEILQRANDPDSQVAAGLTPVELDQARSLLTAILRLWETLFLNIQIGSLPAEAMDQMGNWYAVCRWPLMAREWDFFREQLGDDFESYVGETCGLEP